MQVTRPLFEYEIVAPSEAIVSWKHNAVTIQVLDIVNQEINNSQSRVGQGETLGDNIVQDTARAVGYVEGLMFLRTMMDIVNFIEDREDAEDERKQTKKDTKAVR